MENRPPQHRVIVKWHDPKRPDWGACISSLDSGFQQYLLAFVEAYGPPTRVEFRAGDEKKGAA